MEMRLDQYWSEKTIRSCEDISVLQAQCAVIHYFPFPGLLAAIAETRDLPEVDRQ